MGRHIELLALTDLRYPLQPEAVNRRQRPLNNRGWDKVEKTMSNRDIVNEFFDKWSRGDIEAALALCTDDVIWDNVPMKTIAGKSAVHGFLAKFAKGMSDIHYELRGVMEDGDRLMLEGVENYTKNGRKVSVPYMASFDFRDGRISAWRDYFDLATVERQLA